jgi:hypothetical protein
METHEQSIVIDLYPVFTFREVLINQSNIQHYLT